MVGTRHAVSENKRRQRKIKAEMGNIKNMFLSTRTNRVEVGNSHSDVGETARRERFCFRTRHAVSLPCSRILSVSRLITFTFSVFRFPFSVRDVFRFPFSVFRFIILFSTLTLASCVDEVQFDNTPEGNMEALWKIIDEHYCFLDDKAEAIGLDWDEVHARYRGKLDKNMSSAQLQEVLCNMLAELRDGHVNLYTASDVGRYWAWKEDYPSNLNDEIRDSYLGTDYRIASGLYYRILDDNVGYIVYKSFSSGIGEGNIAEVLHHLRLCSGLIIDVRGNGGGQLDYAQRLASHFTNERILTGYRSHKTGTGHSDFSDLTPEYLEPSTTVRWQKPAIVLTNRGCYSATNTFVRDMLCCPNVRTLGDSTGGGSGMPFTSELPNGWLVRFSACPQYDREKRHIEFGIAPTIPCDLKAGDVAKGEDTLIETARKLLTR